MSYQRLEQEIFREARLNKLSTQYHIENEELKRLNHGTPLPNKLFEDARLKKIHDKSQLVLQILSEIKKIKEEKKVEKRKQEEEEEKELLRIMQINWDNQNCVIKFGKILCGQKRPSKEGKRSKRPKLRSKRSFKRLELYSRKRK
jgi:hypothetical protein